MDILQVVTDTDRRGAQVFAVDLEQGLRDLGASVRTLALTAGRVGGLDLETLGPSRRHPTTLRALHRAMVASDVTVAHGSTTLPMTALAGLGRATPTVYRQISDPGFWASTPRRRIQTRAALRRMRHVVALYPGVAHEVAEMYGLPSELLTSIPNAVPSGAFSPPQRTTSRTPGPIRVGYVGALSHEKGVDLLLRAAAAVGASVTIAGDGPERAQLEQLTRELDLDATFLGSVPDPRPVYEEVDLFCLPSRGGDSMPAVLIEASLCGLASVSTDVGGIPEVVRDGLTGLIAPHGDLDALTKHLQTLCEDSDLRLRFGSDARAYCSTRFTIPPVATSWLDVLERSVR